MDREKDKVGGGRVEGGENGETGRGNEQEEVTGNRTGQEGGRRIVEGTEVKRKGQ